jgi:hypothetical protein
MKGNLKSTILFCGIMLLTACASDKPIPRQPKPLSAEQILRESQGMAQLGQKYNEGESMVRDGESLVSQGNQLIVEGQKKMTEGRRIMQESEQGYGEIKKQ